MTIISSPFRIQDQDKDCLRISIKGSLTGVNAEVLRSQVAASLRSDYELVYIDAAEVTEVNLAGINEVIHSDATLKKASKELVFLYRQNSPIEQWIETTGMERFVRTAIVPES